MAVDHLVTPNGQKRQVKRELFLAILRGENPLFTTCEDWSVEVTQRFRDQKP
jgi:hypothetical protein